MRPRFVSPTVNMEEEELEPVTDFKPEIVKVEPELFDFYGYGDDDDDCGDLEFKIEQDENEGTESDNDYSEAFPVVRRTARIELNNRRKRNAKAKKSEGRGKKVRMRSRKKRVSELTPEEQEKLRAKWKEEARRKRERHKQKLIELKAEGVEPVKKPYRKGECDDDDDCGDLEFKIEQDENEGTGSDDDYKLQNEDSEEGGKKVRMRSRKKRVSELTPEEQEKLRAKWKEEARRKRERQRQKLLEVKAEGVEPVKKPYRKKRVSEMTSEELQIMREKWRKQKEGKVRKNYKRKSKRTCDLTEESRERRNTRKREYYKRMAKLGLKRKKRSDMPLEELERRRRYDRERHKRLKEMGRNSKWGLSEKALAELTPEQLEQKREEWRQKQRINQCMKKANMTEEQLKEERMKGYIAYLTWKAHRTPEEWEKILERKRELKRMAKERTMTPEEREQYRERLRIRREKIRLRKEGLLPPKKKGRTPKVPKPKVKKERILKTAILDTAGMTPEQLEKERISLKNKMNCAKYRSKKKLLAAGASEEVIAAEMQRVEDEYAAMAPQLFPPKYRHNREPQPSTGPSSPEICQTTDVVSEPIPVNHDHQFEMASYHHPIKDYQPELSKALYYHSFDGAPSPVNQSPPPSPDPQPDPWNPPASTPTSNQKGKRGPPKKEEIHVGPPPIPRVTCEASYYHSYHDAPFPVHHSPPPCVPEPDPEWNPPVSTPPPPTSDTSTTNVTRPKRGRPKKGEIRVPLPPPPRKRDKRVSYQTNPDAFPEICDECGNRYTCKKYLDKHMVMVHTGDFKDGTCTTCGEKFDTASRFYVHWYEMHRTREIRRRRPRKVDVEADFICEDCGISCCNEANLKRHWYYEHGPGNLPENWNACHLCPKRFKHKGALNIHLTVSHRLLQYRCNHCHQSFAKLFMLNSHITQEHPDKVWVCKYCGALRNTEIARDFHVSTGNCKKIPKEEYVKWKMENVGFERERLKCEFCETVVDSKALVDHYKHTHGVKEDKWECMYCSKVTPGRDYFGVHLIDMHGMDVKEVLEKIRYLNVKDRSKVKVMNLKGKFNGVRMEQSGEVEEDEEDEEEDEEGAIKLRKSRRKYPIKDGGDDAGDGPLKKKRKYKRRRNEVAKEVEVGSEESEEEEEFDPNMPEVERLKRKYGRTQSKTRGRKKKEVDEEEESDDDYVPKEVKSRSSRYETRGIKKTYKEDDDDDEEEDEVQVNRTRRTNFQSDPKLNMNPVVMLVKCDKLLLVQTKV